MFLKKENKPYIVSGPVYDVFKMFMKAICRIVIVLLTLFFYCSCQREVTGIPPADNPPSDSTTTGTDTTINVIRDSLVIISFSPDSGHVGSEIKILGSGFDSIATRNAVWINTTAAAIISATKTVLTVQVPEGSATGKLSVAANGKTATSLTDFVVLKDSAVSDSAVTGTNAWTRKADFPVSWASTAITAITVGTKGYFYKGQDLWEYTPARNQWTKKANRPAGPGGFYSFAFSVNNKIYFGSNSQHMPDSVALWEYTIATDSWTQKRNLPIAPRRAAFGFALNNTGYAGGGQIGFGTDSIFAHDFWKYDAEKDTWSRQANFPGTWTISLSNFVIDNEAYVYDAGLGFPQAPMYSTAQGRLWHYDAATNTWTEKATCPGGIKAMSAVAFSIGSKGYVAVSVYDHQDSPRDDFWMYDPATDFWIKKADVGGGLHWFGSGFAIGNKGYVGLGTGNTAVDLKNDFWEYTPE